MNNFFIIVLDGLGIGELPDASEYGDQGSNTLKNMAEAVGGLKIPNLGKLGLGNIDNIKGVPPSDNPLASFGKAAEISSGKDSTTGHWEMGGVILTKNFSYFHEGFPPDITNKFLELTGLKGFLGNTAASGTEIIQQLGDEHKKTGYPIIYTSADSVFQIAAHEDIIPLEKLYSICKITRDKVLVDPYLVGRVIARPFVGSRGSYSRTTNRKDFSLDPPGDTILDVLKNNGIITIGIGKINDLFNYRGIQIQKPAKTNRQEFEILTETAKNYSGSFIFINFVDFDVLYGHRNDPEGFSNALNEFDNFLGGFLSLLDETDALVITADHGNDPTTPSTDHSREYVPILFYRKNHSPVSLRIRKTFADIGRTAAEFFNVKNNLMGESFLNG